MLASLANGEEVLSSIALGTQETFSFQVDDAGTVRVSVGETEAGFPASVFLQVFDSAGSLVASDFDASDAVVQFETLQTGTFTAIVSETQNDQPLEFRIRALTLPSNPQLIDGRDDVLQDGEEVLSSIPLGAFATFPFQVDDAGTIEVSVDETGAGFPASVFLQVFDSAGNLVASDFDTSDAVVQFTTFQTGTFTAVVSETQNDQPLEFQIIATGISDQPISPLLGDVNGDGVVDFSDIPSFISVLQSGDFLDEADINGDGRVDFADIPFFIDLLIAQ